MGCDIHLHIELQDGNGDWVHSAAPHIGRNYRLFEKMAGVRGDLSKAVSPPKGLPGGLSLVTLVSYRDWGPDAHSMSWLSSDEIIGLEEWLSGGISDLEKDILHCYLFDQHSFMSFKQYDDVEYLPKPFTDIRFVFWFDN